MKDIKRLFSLTLALSLLLSGCTQAGDAQADSTPSESQDIYIESVPLEERLIEDEAVALASSPAAVNELLLPVASGTAVETKGNVRIDYSNISDGYVMVQYGASNTSRMKVQVAGPSTTYTYDLPASAWTTFPLSDGNGSYKVTVLQNTQGKKYATLASISFIVTLKDEFAPFIRPNQYVDYSNAENTIQKAAELTADLNDPLKKVEKIYDYVVNTLQYDAKKASSVKSGYLPVLDEVLAEKKGICFDYAALMAGMLRSQGVPCKLVVGYAGTAYHAWISVWTEETGWIDNAIYFDGSTWHRMDPTFASSGKSSASILKFIGDGSHYQETSLY